MGAPLNVFKTVTANLTTTTSSVYSPPYGYTTVVLMASVANTSGAVVTVSSQHVRSGIPTAVISGASVPVNDSLNILSGKLVLETGDTLNMTVSANNSAQLLLSILETLNP